MPRVEAVSSARNVGPQARAARVHAAARNSVNLTHRADDARKEQTQRALQAERRRSEPRRGANLDVLA